MRLFRWVAVAMMAGIGSPAQTAPPLTEREQMLLEKIAALEARLSALEKRLEPEKPAPPVAAPAATAAQQEPTVNLYFDGYYAWNANRPLGRANLLRAYDTTANNFSVNQAGVVIERAADAGAGKRWGYRLDLMWGQATDTLQGNPANEPRPAIYRNLFQAYGTYVIPIGKGLTTDFGKWASALGPEGNYTKDQINYSRSYFFNFLPYYHMGFRTSLPLNDRVTLGYWLVNGANQTEDFNGFKSQLGQAVLKPSKNVTWTLNYYNGQEQRDALPATPRGRLHVIDTYAFWNPNEKVTLGGEFDYVVNRVQSSSSPQVVVGGAAYFRYQLTPKIYFGQRYTRLNDRAGLFSGRAQNLNDTTSTLGFRPADGFEARVEYRRDFSNVAYFLKRRAGELSTHQDTFTLGLLWWFGGKTGGW